MLFFLEPELNRNVTIVFISFRSETGTVLSGNIRNLGTALVLSDWRPAGTGVSVLSRGETAIVMRTFSQLYTDAIALTEMEIRSPHVTKRQMYRCNTPALDVENYYRTAVYTSLLDNVLPDLKERLVIEAQTAYELFLFVPPQICATREGDKKMSRNYCSAIFYICADKYLNGSKDRSS